MNNIGTVGKIIITKEIEKQFDYYHNQIKNKEWSGILFYNHIKGNIHSLKNLEFKATNFFLMDIGSGAFTNFESDSDIIEAYDNIGDSELSSLQGFCHSHHTMNAFFSGTDLKELEDNAASYNFYVSLIVNVAKEYVCKIVFPSKTTTVSEHLITDSNGKIKKVKTKSESTILLSGDLDVEFEVEKEDVSDWVKNRINIIEEKKKAKEEVKKANNLSKYYAGVDPYSDDYFSNPHGDYVAYGKPTAASLKKDNDNHFINEILLKDDNISLFSALSELVKGSEEDWGFYLDYLDNNIEIIFENSYETRISMMEFNRAISLVIKEISSFKHMNRVQELIDYLNDLKNIV